MSEQIPHCQYVWQGWISFSALHSQLLATCRWWLDCTKRVSRRMSN